MQVLDAIDTEAIAELRGREEFFWLDLRAPDPDQIHRLGDLFGYHPLAIEDTLEFHQRPKLDDYEDHVLLVYYGMDGHELVEVHCYVSGEAIVTVHHGHCAALVSAFKRLQRVDARSEEEAIYRVLDALTDSFFPALEEIDDAIDDLLAELAERHAEDQRRRIFDKRRKLAELRRTVGPMRDVFATGGDTIERLPGLNADHAHDYFRDIYDHLLRISDQVDSQRDLLAGALDVYLSTQSNEMNVVMERLTLVATIFLPLTFLTGFFGQNFGWLVKHIDSGRTFLIWGIGGVIVSIAVIVTLFVRSGYLRR